MVLNAQNGRNFKMKKYTCPQCGEKFDKLCGPVN